MELWDGSISSYYIDNYRRYLTLFASFILFELFSGISAIQGVQRTPLVSGAYASAKTHPWSRSGEIVFCQTWRKGMEPSRKRKSRV